MHEPTENAPIAAGNPKVRIRFLRAFGAWFLAILVFVFAAVGGAAFRQPDWVFSDASGLESRPNFVLLRDYVRLQTVTPPGNEKLGTDFLAARLRAAGIESEEICPAPGRCNLVARIEGVSPRGGLLLLHHIDVQPADEKGWSAPPFEARIVGGDVVGRGVIDDKSMGIAYLEAFLAVASSGRRPERTLVYVADADEESVEQDYGVRWLLEHRPDIFRGIDYALNEGGVNETPEETIQYWGIEVGHPAVLSFRLAAKDRPALEAFVKRIEEREAPWRITPIAREYFQRIATLRKAAWRERANDIDAALRDAHFVRELPMSYRTLFRTSAYVKPIESTADGFEAEAFLFVPVDQDPQPDIDWVRGEVSASGGAVRISGERHQPRSISVPFRSALTRRLEEEIRKTYPSTPIGPYITPVTSNTSKYLRLAGILAYGFSPFRITIHQAMGIHGTEEKMSVQAFLDGVELTRGALSAFAFETPSGVEIAALPRQ